MRLSLQTRLSTVPASEGSTTFDLEACRHEASEIHAQVFKDQSTLSWREAKAPWSWLDRELSSNVAGETGAVCIYEGARAALLLRGNASTETLAFIDEHRDTEASHLELFLDMLPPEKYTRLLPAWRVAGFSLGFLPALVSDRWLFLTVEAVETFVEEHYNEQITPLLAGPHAGVAPHLVALLQHCCEDEVHHKEDAARRAGIGEVAADAGRTAVERAWMAIVRVGSAVAASLARRI